MQRDSVKGLRLLQDCLTCPNQTPGTYARLADLQSPAEPLAALQTLRAGTRAHPRAALLWQLRGRLALTHSERKEGIDALSHAQRLRPDDTMLAAELKQALSQHGDNEARATIAVSGYLEEATAAFDRGAIKEAEEALQSALLLADKAPKTGAELRRRLALVFIARGKLPEALLVVGTALRDVPEPSVLRAALLVTHADLLIASGDNDGALISAAAAAEINPEDPLAHTNVAVARALRKEWSLALLALRRAIEQGLPQHLTRKEFTSIEAFAPVKKRKDFLALVNAGWPAK
jgi:tetratricopeptide (TPR) repeat protein